MSTSSVLLTVFFFCVLLAKFKLIVVVPKINAREINAIATTAQIFMEQNSLPFLIIQFCINKQGFSKHVFTNSIAYSSSCRSWTVMVTLDELLNIFPLMYLYATHWYKPLSEMLVTVNDNLDLSADMLNFELFPILERLNFHAYIGFGLPSEIHSRITESLMNSCAFKSKELILVFDGPSVKK